MFQITIIENNNAKLIDPPRLLLEALGEADLLFHKNYINIDALPVIQRNFPSVVITHISRKTLIKKYPVKTHLKELFDKARKLCKTGQRRITIDSLEDFAIRNCGLSDAQYKLLIGLSKWSEADLDFMYKKICKKPEKLVTSEKKLLLRQGKVRNPRHGDILNQIYRRLYDQTSNNI